MCCAVLFSILLRTNSSYFSAYEMVEALLTHNMEMTMHIQQCLLVWSTYCCDLFNALYVTL
jgi:hypothetical protein